MKKIIFSIILILIMFACSKEEKPVQIQMQTDQQLEFDFEEDISLLSFNIQIFGKTKAGKPEVMDILSDIIMQFDLITIQEVRDASGTAVPILMNMLTPNYKYMIGPREGRSNSKEQYLFIYDTEVFFPVNEYVHPDEDDIFERNPYSVHFQSINSGFDFVVINNHIAPNAAREEIPAMIQIIKEAESYFQEYDIIIVGDFNADGSYFSESKLVDVFNEDEYIIVIPNSANTTVASSDNTYDRIIITNEVQEDWNGEWGVYYFNDYYDFTTIEPKHVSDHYPVWIKLYIERDTQ